LRYVVVETDFRAPGSSILISPDAIAGPDRSRQVSSWPLPRGNGRNDGTCEAAEDSDFRLRSVREVLGYAASASDAEIGKIDDFIVEEGDVDAGASWRIRYLVIDTADWLPGKKVLLAPVWIREINRAGQRVSVPFATETIAVRGL
jgi:hypothetical protein